MSIYQHNKKTNKLNHMFGYQILFQESAQKDAEGIFDKLDKKLNPKVSLIGIALNDNKIKNIYFEPFDNDYSKNDFDKLIELAEQLKDTDKEKDTEYGHPDHFRQKAHVKKIKLRSIKRAIQKIIRKRDDNKGVISFCSFPVEVRGVLVSTVLQLNKRIFKSYDSLKRAEVDDFPLIKTTTSLLHAIISKYLNECSRFLHNKVLTGNHPFDDSLIGKAETDEALDVYYPSELNKNMTIIDDYFQVIRSAARELMYSPAYATKNMAGLKKNTPDSGIGHNIFETINELSSMQYEGQGTYGEIVLSGRNHPATEVKISFINKFSPFYFKNYRLARKLINLSSDVNGLCLLADSAQIYGAGKFIKEKYNSGSENLFKIQFIKQNHWELLHPGKNSDQVLMRVINGKPCLPAPIITEETLKEVANHVFDYNSNVDLKKLWDFVEKAVKQKKGTTVIITHKARDESKRLNCIKIDPVVADRFVGNTTSIDGAVLLDIFGKCHAIGAILDGTASRDEDVSRGARYNSAIRYVESQNDPCLAIVVSTDGMINFFPDHPTISRSKISNAINELKALKNKTPIEETDLLGKLGILNELRFYLSDEQCDEVNKLREEIKKNVTSNNIITDSEKPIYDKFVTNKRMNNTYFKE